MEKEMRKGYNFYGTFWPLRGALTLYTDTNCTKQRKQSYLNLKTHCACIKEREELTAGSINTLFFNETIKNICRYLIGVYFSDSNLKLMLKISFDSSEWAHRMQHALLRVV